MAWIESATSLTSDKTVVIDKQDGLQISAFQPFLTLTDSNAGNKQAKIQNADGKLVFYTQSALNAALPTVVLNTLAANPGQPPPSAVEIHAQDGVHTIGFQPFLTLTDANAGFAKARIQNADGKLVFYTQSALNAGVPLVIFNTLAVSGGQPVPTAIEIHAQDGVNTVGFQPFLTLTDANAGFARARIQNAGGDINFFTEASFATGIPPMKIVGGSGKVEITTDIVLTGADCAEEFDVSTREIVERGTVMVIDESGALRQSDSAYDRKVAGVVSGAGHCKPAIVLDRQTSSEDRIPIALVGKVYCKVDADTAPIEVGDLLTTSTTMGHAMRAADPIRAFGAVLGKALGALREGRGLIPILVTLQ